eukprot:162859-Amphidinium_carterae.1
MAIVPMTLWLLGSVSSLGQRQVLIAGDWNFEPSGMPIDLIHGGQVVRPLSDDDATAPKGERVNLDRFLTSKMLAPACGLKEATDLKPDHVAVRLLLKLERHSSGFRRQRIYEVQLVTDKREVEAGYMAARANSAGAWIFAVQENDAVSLLAKLCGPFLRFP